MSILTFFAKVFEKILYNTTTNHAIITLIDKITKSVDNGDIAINIFIDLEKAFDTVPHEILLKELFNYGIKGNVLQLCESYLTNRYQYVTFNGTKSLHKRVTCGVPQGSILGPLFSKPTWTIFTVHLNSCTTSCTPKIPVYIFQAMNSLHL